MMAMRYLTQHGNDRPHSARDIADACKLPLPVLAKTLHALSKAALVISQYGSTGGYILARPAREISALDVINAFDGPLVITSCMTVHGSCEMIGHCAVQEPLLEINDKIRSLLHSISLADLLRTEGKRTGTEESLITIIH